MLSTDCTDEEKMGSQVEARGHGTPIASFFSSPGYPVLVFCLSSVKSVESVDARPLLRRSPPPRGPLVTGRRGCAPPGASQEAQPHSDLIHQRLLRQTREQAESAALGRLASTLAGLGTPPDLPGAVPLQVAYRWEEPAQGHVPVWPDEEIPHSNPTGERFGRRLLFSEVPRQEPKRSF